MLKVAIIGYGNIGKGVEQAITAATDMKLAGIYHHNDDLTNLKDIDVAILCTPTRETPAYAQILLKQGISTIDSFDIHTQIFDVRQQLMPIAKKNGAVSIISAGWDPGSDSMIRCILEALAPKGITYTNFGPGRSMGHSVAAKAIKGVKDALSMTIPIGTGLHRRMVYVELEQDADFKEVEAAILNDDYFVHDETHVIQVPSVDALNNVAHGVNLVRSGVSGSTHNQRFEFNMTINNPALTGQFLVDCARATQFLNPGCYTTVEIPPIAFIEGGASEENIRKLV